jgi:hypothetical protein
LNQNNLTQRWKVYSTTDKKDDKNYHDHNIIKWIHHRFNQQGIDDIVSKKKHNHKQQQYKFDNDIEKQIVDIASSNPRSFGLGFSTWSLLVLTGFLIHDLKMVGKISHSAEIMNILIKHEIKWRKSKTVLSNKSDDHAEYALKKSTLNS